MNKRFTALLGCFIILGSCQTQPFSTPIQTPSVTAFSQIRRQASTSMPPLKLSPSFQQQLKQMQTLESSLENNPQSVDEKWVEQMLSVQYIKSHSYYFQTRDTGMNGESSVTGILKNDGHNQASQWIKHWEALLGEASIWPDAQSTTYQGRWPALEHAELKGGDGWFMFRSASEKADEYYERALKAWKHGLPADHPTQAEAWRWLGRTAHFIHDVTVPFHTVSLLRPAQLIHHTPYEKSCDEQFMRYLPSRNHNPAGVWENGPYPQGETWGIYFSENTSAGEMVKYAANNSRPFYGLVNESEKENNWEKTRAVMIPLGAKLTAGLILQFLREVKA